MTRRAEFDCVVYLQAVLNENSPAFACFRLVERGPRTWSAAIETCSIWLRMNRFSVSGTVSESDDSRARGVFAGHRGDLGCLPDFANFAAYLRISTVAVVDNR